MKTIAHTICCVCLSTLLTLAAGCTNPVFKGLGNTGLESSLSQLNWEKSYDDAIMLAQQTGKPILANFTGSDWCHWCKKLHRDVFDHPEFADWAGTNVVLLELDFPQRQSQEQWINEQNDALARQFSINSYPTVVLINADGLELGRLGYVAGGAQKWIDAAEHQMGSPSYQE